MLRQKSVGVVEKATTVRRRAFDKWFDFGLTQFQVKRELPQKFMLKMVKSDSVIIISLFLTRLRLNMCNAL